MAVNQIRGTCATIYIVYIVTVDSVLDYIQQYCSSESGPFVRLYLGEVLKVSVHCTRLSDLRTGILCT